MCISPFTLLNLIRNKGSDIACCHDKHTRTWEKFKIQEPEFKAHAYESPDKSFPASKFPFYLSHISSTFRLQHFYNNIILLYISHWIALTCCRDLFSSHFPHRWKWKMENFLVSSITCDVVAADFICFWYIVCLCIFAAAALETDYVSNMYFMHKTWKRVQWLNNNIFRALFPFFSFLLSSRLTSYRLFAFSFSYSPFSLSWEKLVCIKIATMMWNERERSDEIEYGDDKHQIIINNDSSISLNVTTITTSTSRVGEENMLEMNPMLQFINNLLLPGDE